MACCIVGTPLGAQIDWGRVKTDPTFGDVRKQHPAQTARQTSKSTRARAEEQRKAQQEQESARQEEAAREQRYLAALTLLKPVQSIPAAQQYPSTGRIEPRPSGTLLFDAIRHGGGDLETTLDQIDFDKKNAFTRSTTTVEDAYRALYLMEAARNADGWEDARFLADQAALAMDREPILVVIQHASRTTDTNRRIVEFLKQRKRVEELQDEWVATSRERRRIEQSRSHAHQNVKEAKEALATARADARQRLAARFASPPSPQSSGAALSAPPAINSRPPSAVPDDEEDDLVRRAKQLLASATETLLEIDGALQQATANERNKRKELADSIEKLSKL